MTAPRPYRLDRNRGRHRNDTDEQWVAILRAASALYMVEKYPLTAADTELAVMAELFGNLTLAQQKFRADQARVVIGAYNNETTP